MKELKDNELLEFLMTSDFNENYKSEEFKFLLHKFRYFYRILHGKSANLVNQKDLEITEFMREIAINKQNIQTILFEKAELQNTIDLQPSIRKLTLMERLVGKVNLKNNNKK